MAKLSIKAGSTSKLVKIFIQNNSVTTGAGLTGLTSGTSGLTAYYIKEGDATTTQIVLTSATLGTFTSSGFIVVDATNMPGVYELGIPNAAIASGKSCIIYLQGATSMAPVVLEIELTAVDNQSTGFGLVNASANAVQINGVSTSSVTTINANQGTTQPLNFTGTGGTAFVQVDLKDIAGSAVSATTAQLGVNVVNWNNTVVATPATAGIPDVNIKNMNNVAATSITTINANQGTTQPINFNGTAGTAMVKTDVEQINTQTVTAAAGVTFPTSVASPTNITAGTITTVTNLTNAPTAGDFTSTMKTSLNAATPASITGNVAGNVTGSVGSVLTGGLIDLTTTTYAEPSAVPAATATLKDKINWLTTTSRNKITQTATTQLIRNDGDSGTIGTSTVSDDGTTAIRGKYT